jgi:ATP-dependent Clp protease adaptor protein ClpS
MAATFDTNQESEVEEITELKKPSRYRVMLHNDDYTSMEFVVMILKVVFGKTDEDAIRIMYDVHQNGIGIAGIYTKEIAETRVQLVHTKAKENGFPLRASMEKI